jgi:hypothetical protein
MASNQANSNHRITMWIGGAQHTVNITVREDGINTPDADTVAALVARTIFNYSAVVHAMHERLTVLADDVNVSAWQANVTNKDLQYAPSSQDPYVTVWGYPMGGASVTLHEFSTPNEALFTAAVLSAGIALVRQHGEKRGITFERGASARPQFEPSAPPPLSEGEKAWEDMSPLEREVAPQRAGKPVPAPSAPHSDLFANPRLRTVRFVGDSAFAVDGKGKLSQVLIASTPYNYRELTAQEHPVLYRLMSIQANADSATFVMQSADESDNGRSYRIFKHKKDKTDTTYDWLAFEKDILNLGLVAGDDIKYVASAMPLYVAVKLNAGKDGNSVFTNYHALLKGETQ